MIHLFKNNAALQGEWRNIKKKRILLISSVVMLFIPIMYGGFFLGSIWDPYGNTQHLPVAVVNKDEGTTLNGMKLAVGDTLVTELKKNHDMGWRFVSESEAASGLKNGTYYMRLTIPKDFSRDASSVTSDQPTKSTIEYTLTPARNYIASLLTRQAAEQIEKNVSTTIADAYVTSILESIKTLSTGMSTASSGANQLSVGSAQLYSGIQRYTGGVQQIYGGHQSLNQGFSALESGSLAVKNGLDSLGTSLPSSAELQQLSDGVTTIQNGLATLSYSISHPDGTVTAAQANVVSDAAGMQQKISDYATAATNATDSITTLETAIANGQSTATVDVNSTLGVIGASQALVAQSGKLLADLSTLTTLLNSQQAALTTNLSTLASGMSTLSPSLQSAIGGYSDVTNGTNVLAAGANQVYEGVMVARQGSGQLLASTAQLDISSNMLITGSVGIQQGSSELAKALEGAAGKLSVQPTGSATAGQIVSPVIAKEIVDGSVPNYGFALSPYVLSLGLFVGALVFNVIYPVRRFFCKPKNALSWWAAKMSIALAVAIGQALVLDAIMVACLGLRPDNPGMFVLATIVTSCAYMSVISFLALALDNVGRFFAMILLVLQLGSAGGVFPIVLSPRFFQAVNPYVPMTYSIYAYREAISSGLGSGIYRGSIGILLGIMAVANVAIIVFLKRHGMRHFSHESVDE